ncbi:MAG: ATP-binding protein [Deltaproteobacteria bacterium]|nr:ATP-binding protein [Deltaproteobacteria bacterium]
MWIPRTSGAAITKIARQFPVVVLTGARQVGKTTLSRALFPKHAYVSLDLPSLAELAETSPADFLARFPPPVVIDEVQYAPAVFRHIKARVDAERHEMGRFVLTGSQRFVLMQAVSESLAGRAAVIELETFDWEEMARAGGSLARVEELTAVLVRGGFPELWRNPEMDADAFFSSYLATYLERDVRQILNVASLRDFERFIRACAARNAQLLDKSSVGSDVGVSAKAVSSWLNVLQASDQVALLEPWFANWGKRLVKTPKLYFKDTGLLCFLLGLTGKSLVRSPFLGPVWETAVFGELRRRAARQGRRSLWFYRDVQGREVDFLLLGGGRPSLVECKWTDVPQPSDGRTIREVMALAEARRTAELARSRGFVICRTPHPHPLGPEVTGIGPGDMDRLFA